MIKVPFKVKYGQNVIEIPINTGDKVYHDNASGLAEFNKDVFTIINQVPESQTVPTKTAWKKHRLLQCCKRDGLYDKTSGQMSYKANTWTAYIRDWHDYKPPLWVNGGYYAMSEAEQDGCFTVNVGDLLIFADIPDDTPTTLQEFVLLQNKYKDSGGIITGVEVYIQHKPDGTPWKTNHIEVIKA